MTLPRWIALAASLAIVIALLGGLWLRSHLEPIARQRIVETLESKLHCEVELDEVHLSVTHGLAVDGRGLRIMDIGSHARRTPGGTPMLVVRSFQFASTFSGLLLHSSSAITAYAQGLVMTIPPADDRTTIAQGNPKKRNQPRNSLFLNKLVATDSRLVLESSKPGKPPIVFNFKEFVLEDPGKNDPFVFDAVLVNPKPVGEVHTTGHIGPWVFNNSRQSPVDANFTFDHADLSTIKGLAGTLASSGRLSGTLGRMSVHGLLDIPDFSLDLSDHAFPVHSEYQARVDGTDGNVALDEVSAHFLHTSLNGNGLISRADKVPGHDVNLDIHLKDGRAEDLLTLFSKAPRPLLTGSIRLQGHLEVPPGVQSFALKLRAKGTADIAGIAWSNPKVQQQVDQLSLRAQDVGKAKQAIQDPAASPRVKSALRGGFVIQHGNIDIGRLVYQMPGATLLMHGRYPLLAREMEFHGVARTIAPASHLETGIKSLLLKPISPFLKKNGAGMQLPVSFTGDKAHPHFALDLMHDKADAESARASKGKRL